MTKTESIPAATELSEAKRRLLEKYLRGDVSKTYTIPRRPEQGPAPLSFGQQRLWFLDQLEPGSSSYNISTAARVIGPLNIPALEQSFGEILRRHEALRTTIATVNGSPVQVVASPSRFVLPQVDLGAIPEDQREAATRRLGTEKCNLPFDLAKGPLFRAGLMRLDETQHVLLVTIHHIVSDGWSLGLFCQELSSLYDAFSNGRPSPFPELQIQYRDFAGWQRQSLQGDALENHLSYWKQQLTGQLPVLELPTDRPRPPVQTYRAGRQSLQVPDAVVARLNALGHQERATLFMTMLAAFKILLYRHAALDDIIVGIPIAGRNRVETEGLIGFFISTLVLRTDLSGNPTFRELVRRVREVAVGAYEHQDLPFEKLVEELQPKRSLSHTPLFQVFFNMFDPTGFGIQLPGMKAERFPTPDVELKFDLSLYVQEQHRGLHLKFVYNADLFEAARMKEWLEQLLHLLEQIAASPDSPILSYSLVTPAAKKVLPDPTRPLPATWENAVHEKFSVQARRTPDRVAVVDKNDHWTYGELDSCSDRLANHFRAAGIQPQQIVAIYGHRSASLLLAILGVWKAGAAFLLLDPMYPAVRLAECVRQARPQGWIRLAAAGSVPTEVKAALSASQCRLSVDLPDQKRDMPREKWAESSLPLPPLAVRADDLAYVMFTSGSTGEPKGILSPHGALSHFLEWHATTFGFTGTDRFSLLSGLSHDIVLRDLFAPCWVGASLHVPDSDPLDSPQEFANWMKREEITVSHLTPAMSQVLVQSAGEQHLSSLRFAFFGGDALTECDVAHLRVLAPHVTCVNFYGATETPQTMGHFVVANADRGAAPITDASNARIPVGRGIEGVQLLVLNTERQLAGIGELGEIYIRTPYLAKGYLGDESLTRERFLSDPFGTEPKIRLYRTGDLGRYLPEGAVQFIGRGDNQVKLRGFRVELGEIESVLRQHPHVRQVVVLAIVSDRGEKQLVAYVVAGNKGASARNELRRFLEKRLPLYMVPTFLVELDSLPLTPNGKVDRKALPAPNHERTQTEVSAPRNATEETLISLWKELLPVEHVGATDNFFDLGGHSLLAIQLLARIREAVQVNLPVRTLFESPTVAGLAQQIEAKHSGASTNTGAPATGPQWTHLVPIQQGGAYPPLFLLPGGGGGEEEFLVYAKLVRLMGEQYTVYGLQAAGIDGTHKPHEKVEQMASDYLKEIRAVQDHGPYVLIGECVGGILAYEMARQLREQCEETALLGLLDTARPTLGRYLRHRYINMRQPDFSKFFGRIVFHVRALSSVTWKDWAHYLFDKLRKSWLVLQLEPKPPKDDGETPNDHMQQIRHGYSLNLLRYRPKPYDGRVTLLINEDDYKAGNMMGWAKLAKGGIEVHVLPGHHLSYIRHHVQSTAEQLRSCIDAACEIARSRPRHPDLPRAAELR